MESVSAGRAPLVILREWGDICNCLIGVTFIHRFFSTAFCEYLGSILPNCLFLIVVVVVPSNFDSLLRIFEFDFIKLSIFHFCCCCSIEIFDSLLRIFEFDLPNCLFFIFSVVVVVGLLSPAWTLEMPL